MRPTQYRRHQAQRLAEVGTVTCPNCGALQRPARRCFWCGCYLP
ncbi:MAG TPA: 50S ribosomal protein L32 [Candidatus Paceibacterota bacterium]